jgi:predicted PurR-regulated permease PerM
VAILYIIVQIIESNVITPTIEKRMVSTPPALLLASQVIFGTVFGFIGLLLAAPLVAVSIGLWDAHTKDE